MIKVRLLLIIVISICFSVAAHTLPSTQKQKETESEAIDYLLLAKSFYTKSVDKALEFSEKALRKAKQTDNDSLLAHCYKSLGIANYYAGNSILSIPLYDTAMLYFQQLGDMLEIGNIYNNLGIAYSEVGDFNRAIEMYLLSLKITETQADTVALGRLYNNLGTLYYNLQDQSEALSYFEKSYELYSLRNDSAGMMTAKNNIGLVEINLQVYDSALLTFRESVIIGKRNNDIGGTANSLHNIGWIYAMKNMTDSALFYYKKADEQYEVAGMQIGKNYIGIGKCYKDMGEYSKALKAYDKALKIGFKTNDRLLRLDAYNELFEIHKASGNKGAALEVVEKYHVLFDSIKTLFDSTAVINIQARFEIDNKRRELIRLQEMQKTQLEMLNEQQEKLKFQRILSYASLFFLTVVLAFVYFLTMLLRKNKASQTLLRQQNNELEKARSALSSSHDTLIEQEEILRTLINSTPDIICFKDGESRWLKANDSILTLFNLKGINYRMKTDADLTVYSPLHESAHESCMISDEISWQKAEINRSDEEIPDAEGKPRIFDVYKIPLFNADGSRKGIIVWGRDVTERKQAEKKLEYALEKAEESDRLKTAFLSNMSHEIRTPLNAIIGFSDLLGDDDITKDEKSRYIKIIQQNGEALLNLIGNIISLARIEAGETDVNLQDTNLNALFQDVNTNYTLILKQRNKTHLKWEMKLPDQEVTAPFDKLKIRQVIINLLDNALKFTEAGSITYGFEPLLNSEGKIESVNIFVQDTGIGIADDQQRNIFNRFTKLNEHSKKIYSGTGLGLSIVKQYVQLMGGSVRLQSAPEQGSTFSIILPLFKQAKHTAFMQSNHLAAKYNFSNKEILIVEDVDSNFELLNIVLRPTKAKIHRALNGIEAVNTCNDNASIDLVLMDIQLPLLNGLDATMRIKQTRPGLPIIAQTAFAMSEEKEACFAAGCDAYMAKPISAELMLPVLQELLSKSENE
ncbi:MAG: tetratricopeptide repeat protein [Bacteroidales bacterium]|jgi:PAS domain S-box-containing protein|nr:tetratricopeptide repeat protein [Bacteroidales bacterium]